MYRLSEKQAAALRCKVQAGLIRALYREGQLDDVRFARLLQWSRSG
ncbi:MAG: hypothetical protein AB7C89_05555 [Intestinibacillus sp.]